MSSQKDEGGGNCGPQYTSASPHGKNFIKFNHGIDGNDDDGSENGFGNVVESRHQEAQCYQYHKA